MSILDNYLQSDLNILWLDSFDFMTYTKKAEFIKLIDISKDIRANLKDYNKFEKVISQDDFLKLKLLSDDQYIIDILTKYKDDGIDIITIYSHDYPIKLKEIDSPPFILYCKGDTTLLHSKSIAIVGTRKPTDYGKIVTKMYTKALANAELTIISGLAYGVDTLAHEETLRNDGKTIAVLAGGFYNIYPASNINLAKKIAKNGLLICESKPSCVPVAYLFPYRNRILAGLSDGVLITEARENSGTIHTKNYAVDFGRDLYVVPGKITSLESKGCNNILKEMQGAITLSPNDILESFGILPNNNKNNKETNNFQFGFEESAIVNFVRSDKKTYQEILEHTKLSPQQLNAILLSLQVRSIIEKVEGNSYIAN